MVRKLRIYRNSAVHQSWKHSIKYRLGREIEVILFCWIIINNLTHENKQTIGMLLKSKHRAKQEIG